MLVPQLFVLGCRWEHCPTHAPIYYRFVAIIHFPSSGNVRVHVGMCWPLGYTCVPTCGEAPIWQLLTKSETANSGSNKKLLSREQCAHISVLWACAWIMFQWTVVPRLQIIHRGVFLVDIAAQPQAHASSHSLPCPKLRLRYCPAPIAMTSSSLSLLSKSSKTGI